MSSQNRVDPFEIRPESGLGGRWLMRWRPRTSVEGGSRFWPSGFRVYSILAIALLLSSYFTASHRWTSGSPRMLVELVREFESRRGEIMNLFAKIKKKDQLLRAPSVGKHNSTRIDEGSREKNAGHEP